MSQTRSAIYTLALSTLAFGLTVGVTHALGIIGFIRRTIHPMGQMDDFLTVYYLELFFFSFVSAVYLKVLQKNKVAAFLLGGVSGHIMGVIAYFGSIMLSADGLANIGPSLENFGFLEIFLVANMLSFLLAGGLISVLLLAALLLIAYVKDRLSRQLTARS